MATTAQRLAEYEELYKQAQGYDPNKFQNDFEREYNEAVNYNKDLIEQQSSALGELQTVAPTLREKYMNTLISDPTAQMALIAQARQAPITQWSTASNLLNARGQRYQDILGKALGAYQTSANQANTAAENAWRLYQDALQQEQFNAQMRRGSGGGGGGLDLASLLGMYGQEGGQDIVEDGGGLDITVPGKKSSWTQTLVKNATAPLSKNTPDWLAKTIPGTIVNLLGNFIGNTQVPKRKNQSFLDKLFNR
jgi:hypothetical protein